MTGVFVHIVGDSIRLGVFVKGKDEMCINYDGRGSFVTDWLIGCSAIILIAIFKIVHTKGE